MKAKRRKASPRRAGSVGILIDGGKTSATVQRLTTLLHQALMAAIAAGREDTAKVIAKEMASLSGVNYATVSNCNVQMGAP